MLQLLLVVCDTILSQSLSLRCHHSCGGLEQTNNWGFHLVYAQNCKHMETIFAYYFVNLLSMFLYLACTDLSGQHLSHDMFIMAQLRPSPECNACASQMGCGAFSPGRSGGGGYPQSSSILDWDFLEINHQFLGSRKTMENPYLKAISSVKVIINEDQS